MALPILHGYIQGSRLLIWWDAIRGSYWFLPGLMALGSMAVAALTLTVDSWVQYQMISGLGWVYVGGPDGARALLSTVAGSLISVAGVTFSISIAALTLASQQFGPRLLRNFMRDTGNQFVLGTFVATFLYALLVLRTVRGVDAGENVPYNEFVPYVSVTVTVALAVASIGVLIYFIHHVAVSIQAATVVSEVGAELETTIHHLYPERVGREQSDPDPVQGDAAALVGRECQGQVVFARHTGYIQAVDSDTLLQLAVEHDLVLHLKCRPGHFIVKGSRLAVAWPAERVDEQVSKALDAAIAYGRDRTPAQDAQFVIEQLVEIAARALSPGINDPFTALRCIDRLSAGLAYLAERQMPSPYRYDEQHRLRVIADILTWPEIVSTAFDQIRLYGRSNVTVMVRLLEAITIIATRAADPAAREALRQQALVIEQDAREAIVVESDRATIADRYAVALQFLAPTDPQTGAQTLGKS